jgi:23S rRNA pseudoU1915 N3-methylase RlmH
MQLIVAAVGHKMPAWIETGFQEYAKRMPPECRLVLKEIKPIEQHGFTLVDFTKDKMVLSFFKWDVNTQSIEDIDTLVPFHIKELPRA